ncbi:DUF397 domain-containing protein [Streptomyces sp. WAC01280]|uniref:DUF397 domain-containing protein n=1 Tax=Streptomyces sp. WAC01280 TaxID=2487424 RepID=UPI000F7A6C8F|nr:DUF397 domain-containing protein [Streptomyces sp. WAC01280]RSS57507.1 DUF397 domain-containing protein [Streptomyces sp. WAC01280]
MNAAKPPAQFASDAWFKASASAAQNECVEVNASAPAFVGVRDSKAPNGPVLAFELAAFTTAVAVVASGAL